MIDHLDDVEADFRAFYGLTPQDVMAMTGPHFLALVWRLAAYPGVIRARLQDQEGYDQGEIPQGVDRVVESTPAALQAAGLGDVFSFGTG